MEKMTENMDELREQMREIRKKMRNIRNEEYNEFVRLGEKGEYEKSNFLGQKLIIDLLRHQKYRHKRRHCGCGKHD